MKKMIGIVSLFAAIAIFAGCTTSDPAQSGQSDSSTASSTNNSNTISSSTTNSGKELAEEDMESVVISYDNETSTLIVARKGNGNDVYRLNVEPEKLVDSSGNEVPVEKLIEGTVVIVNFNGIIGYSYPAYIPNYTKVEVTEDQDMETVTAAKEALGGMASIDENETNE